MMITKEKFLSRVRIGKCCWVWVKGKDKDGYGKIEIDGKSLRAHRVSYMLWRGNPGSLCVLHTCDNPSCVNPDHLFLGTIADNNQDTMLKGRTAKGDRNGQRKHPERAARGESQWKSKHTDEDILLIRKLYAKDLWTQQDLADRFGETQVNISSIVRGETWRHLPILGRGEYPGVRHSR